jgi:hypothetical protein
LTGTDRINGALPSAIARTETRNEAQMSELMELSERLKEAQREIIMGAAKLSMMPSEGTLRKISDLENTIAAVDALIQEEREKRRQAKVA